MECIIDGAWLYPDTAMISLSFVVCLECWDRTEVDDMAGIGLVSAQVSHLTYLFVLPGWWCVYGGQAVC